MRVISGIARSLPLTCIDGMETRPTTDRIKETLFNMLQPMLADCRFLDLFSGSGSIGIEALSRGAAAAVFVEKNRKACTCIQHNLQFTKLAEHGKLLPMDVQKALLFLEGEPPFDIIFLDPPYQTGLARQTLCALSKSPLVGENTLLVAEESLEEDFSYVRDLGYTVVKEKKYKTNQHIFLKKRQNPI